jgi:hypothetical protein
MSRGTQFYIDGKWVDPVSPNLLDVVNPATEEVAGQISLGSNEDVDLAVAAARRAYVGMGGCPNRNAKSTGGRGACIWSGISEDIMTIDDKTRIELEAAVFRRLVEHLRSRTDVQNIDMMDLAGFCRNCLASWMYSEADAMDLAMTRDACREEVYGMTYVEWKTKHQREATPDQMAALAKRAPKH